MEPFWGVKILLKIKAASLGRRVLNPLDRLLTTSSGPSRFTPSLAHIQRRNSRIEYSTFVGLTAMCEGHSSRVNQDVLAAGHPPHDIAYLISNTQLCERRSVCEQKETACVGVRRETSPRCTSHHDGPFPASTPLDGPVLVPCVLAACFSCVSIRERPASCQLPLDQNVTPREGIRDVQSSFSDGRFPAASCICRRSLIVRFAK